jgi:hypothetical protein
MINGITKGSGGDSPAPFLMQPVFIVAYTLGGSSHEQKIIKRC